MPYSNRDLTAEQWAILTAPDNPDFPPDTTELQDVDEWEPYEYDDRYECGCCMCCGCDCYHDPDYDPDDDAEEGF